MFCIRNSIACCFYFWTICHLPLLFWYVRVEKKLFFEFQILKFRVWLPFFSDRDLTRPMVQNSSMWPSMRKEKSWKTKQKTKNQEKILSFLPDMTKILNTAPTNKKMRLPRHLTMTQLESEHLYLYLITEVKKVKKCPQTDYCLV